MTRSATAVRIDGARERGRYLLLSRHVPTPRMLAGARVIGLFCRGQVHDAKV